MTKPTLTDLARRTVLDEFDRRQRDEFAARVGPHEAPRPALDPETRRVFVGISLGGAISLVLWVALLSFIWWVTPR